MIAKIKVALAQINNSFSGQNYFPEKMGRQVYYHPVERGFEREIQKRLEYWKKLRTTVMIKK